MKGRVEFKSDTRNTRTLFWIEHNGQAGCYELYDGETLVARGTPAVALFKGTHVASTGHGVAERPDGDV